MFMSALEIVIDTFNDLCFLHFWPQGGVNCEGIFVTLIEASN